MSDTLPVQHASADHVKIFAPIRDSRKVSPARGNAPGALSSSPRVTSSPSTRVSELRSGSSIHRERQRLDALDRTPQTAPRDTLVRLLGTSVPLRAFSRNTSIMSGGPTRVASRALARALSRPLHTSGTKDKAAHALNLASAAAHPPPAASSASALPWFARFIGAMLDVALTPAQRAAMLDRNANDDGRGFAAVRRRRRLRRARRRRRRPPRARRRARSSRGPRIHHRVAPRVRHEARGQDVERLRPDESSARAAVAG